MLPTKWSKLRVVRKKRASRTIKALSWLFRYEKQVLSAAKQNDQIKLRSLLNTGLDLDVNVKNWDGVTPLHLATGRQNLKIVKLLLENDANVNIQIVAGYTPLHYSAREGSIEILRVLLEHGADVDSRGQFGDTALHYAVVDKRTDLEMSELLLRYRADVNAQINVKMTFLHLAVLNGNLDTVKLLLRSGADRYLKDDLGESAKDAVEFELESHLNSSDLYAAVELLDNYALSEMLSDKRPPKPPRR
ncbi:MAG: Ankyrin-2 [Icmadophila ericetorum]|nr:Ankyrin-2 [Icmadophila ericetorum]